MGENNGAGRSSRGTLSLVAFVAGAALLAIMPLVFLFMAATGNTDAEIPGTLVILTATAGMILVVVGAAIRE